MQKRQSKNSQEKKKISKHYQNHKKSPYNINDILKFQVIIYIQTQLFSEKNQLTKVKILVKNIPYVHCTYSIQNYIPISNLINTHINKNQSFIENKFLPINMFTVIILLNAKLAKYTRTFRVSTNSFTVIHLELQ